MYNGGNAPLPYISAQLKNRRQLRFAMQFDAVFTCEFQNLRSHVILP
jgi:hypothetical protein